MKETETEFNPLMHELRQHTGSETFTEYAPLGQRVFICTDGIMHLAERGECYWLLDAVASYQGSEKMKAEEFQTWELTVDDKSSAVLRCHDGNENYLVTQKIPFTDIPLKNQTLKLYLVGGTLMLPSEY